MFNIYQSHSLQLLSDQFCEIFTPEDSNPLAKQWVIVQNNEIKEWLSLQLARQNGIAGNLKFIFPSEFIWLLYRLKHSEVPKVLPTDLPAMQWSIFNQLSTNPELLKQLPSFGDIEGDTKRLFQLSSQLADNFDQYQVYRPDMMEAWGKGEFVTSHKDEKWQLSIWRSLGQTWTQSAKTKDMPRRSEAYSELLNWLQDNDDEIWDYIPEQVYVFGLSQASRPFLEIITNISSQRKLKYFTKIIKGIESGPEIAALIENWSKPATEQLSLLKSILNNAQLPFKENEVSIPDSDLMPSLTIHSCHNNRREVEILKDGILNFLDAHPDADVSDVLIMVPDAEDYVGILETVFHEEDPILPVSQLSGRNRQSVEHVIVELLELLSSPFKASAVLKFLNLDAVKFKFNLTDDHLDLLEDWLLTNKIHRLIGDEFNQQYSWRKGLNQLISGFMMQPDPLEVYNGLVPFDELSSSEDAELVAHFSKFIYALKEFKQQSELTQTPSKWIDFTESIVDNFIGGSGESNTNSVSIRKLLDKLKCQIQYTEGNQKVDFSLIKTWLESQFQSQDSNSGRFGQGVTVSSYIPYRSVPFQFIAMLGINESIFPRKAVRPEFDLIYAKPRPGDRILKKDDSYLFLETLEAAQSHLHLSYKGQDQRTDSECLPSILVQQLLDHIGEEKGRVIRHSLHPFNRRYFNDSGLKSYSVSNQNLAKKMMQANEDNPILFTDGSWNYDQSDIIDQIQISDLIDYFTHPSKYILENVLNIKNYNSFNEVSDREHFKLKGLDRYKLDNYLFDSLVKKYPFNQVYDYANAAALIPEKLQGEKLFEAEKQSIGKLVTNLESLTKSEQQQRDVRISFEGIEITGTIGGIYDDMLISYRVSKRRAQHEVSHWLKHLSLVENGEPISKSIFLSNEDGEVDVIEINTEDIPNKNPLSDYLKWFLAKDPILKKAAFFPETSKAFAIKFLDEADLENAKAKAESSWKVTNFNKYGESADFFNSLLWRGYNPIEVKSFQQNSLRFWRPFFEALNGAENE